MTNRCLAIAVLVLLAQAGCTDATGSVSGGQPLIASAGGGAPTWTALYADFFGPSGQASCSAQSGCHVSCATAAGQLGGFVCTSKESCWLGMTGTTQLPPAGAGPACDGGTSGGMDAGSDAGVAGFCNSGVPPVVTPCASNPTTTPLYLALHQASSSSDNPLCADSHKSITYSCNMPCGDPPTKIDVPGGCHQQNATYTFTQDDLTRIATWIQQGAQYN